MRITGSHIHIMEISQANNGYEGMSQTNHGNEFLTLIMKIRECILCTIEMTECLRQNMTMNVLGTSWT